MLMMSSSFAVSASAYDASTSTFVKPNSYAIVDEAETETEAEEETAVIKTAADRVVDEATEGATSTKNLITSGWVKPDADVIDSEGKVYYLCDPSDFYVTTQYYVDFGCYKKATPCVIEGGKYYTKADAELELKKYFEDHTHTINMYKGNKRLFCDGVYYVSSNESVVYYDEDLNRLVARDDGHAYVYVYTTGGVPFFRLSVNVGKKSGGNTYSVVDLIPEKWQIDAGETIGFTIKSDKYDADEFKYAIVYGDDIASIKNGKLTVKGNGPVVVRVYLKKNADVYGEALIYSGKYVSSFCDGYYTCTGNKYSTNYWGWDIASMRDCYIKGWIRTWDGIFIPVIQNGVSCKPEKNPSLKFPCAPDKNPHHDKVSIADLLWDAYGVKDNLFEIIQLYNLLKDDCKDETITWDDFDYLQFYLAQVFNWCD